MRNATKRPFLSVIAVPATALVLAAAVSGCHWFRKDDVFAQTGDNRPLEVPPDLTQLSREVLDEKEGARWSEIIHSSGKATSSAPITSSVFTRIVRCLSFMRRPARDPGAAARRSRRTSG